jgi:hypothetical protein
MDRSTNCQIGRCYDSLELTMEMVRARRIWVGKTETPGTNDIYNYLKFLIKVKKVCFALTSKD